MKSHFLGKMNLDASWELLPPVPHQFQIKARLALTEVELFIPHCSAMIRSYFHFTV